ncbi:MAG: hypothetical protein ACR2IP_02505 [Solirubrobacteraceae bacterium]
MTFNDDLDRERAQIMRAVRQAAGGWKAAMHAHVLAPPDAGFAQRLRALSQAAGIEQDAWELAHGGGVPWQPVSGADRVQPPYELRPGTGRRGPEELWARFDAAIARLSRAIAGSDGAEVADAFGEIAGAAGALADVVAAEDGAHGPVRSKPAANEKSRGRARGAAA